MSKKELYQMDSREQMAFRIAQLENALAELLVETRKGWDSGIKITGGLSKAWTNANNVLNTGRL